MNIEFKIVDKRLESSLDLFLQRATSGAAAVDLRACTFDPLTIKPGQTEIVSSGIAIHIADDNYCGVIAPRSGLGTKHGIILANTVGVIDSDYTGEIKIATWNRSDQPFTIQHLDRLCQMLFVPVAKPSFTLVEEFSVHSDRGADGFGSTGTA